jgi:hypothetical protein
VYQTLVTNINDLKNRIQAAVATVGNDVAAHMDGA